MSYLSPNQIKWWKRLDQLVQEKHVKDQHGLQAVMRQLALEVIAEQPYGDRIQLGTQVLRRFGENQRFKTKAEFIEYHKKNGRWGDDSLLFPLLATLGYQSFMHLANTPIYPYSPYEQTNRCGLKIDIVNHGAVNGGYHWELKGRKNPGNGNCMYYTVAQQIEKDMHFMSEQVNLAGLASYQINKNPTLKSRIQRILTRNEPTLTKEEEAYYIERYKVEKAKEQEIEILLTTYSTDKLITLYNALKNLADGDTYLINRPHSSAEEQSNNNFMQIAIETGYWDKDIEFLLREELIHALAKEAWRNHDAYEALLKDFKETQLTHQLGFFSQKPLGSSCAAEVVKEEFTTAPTVIPTLA